MKAYANELAAADAKMKNDRMGEALFGRDESMVATVVPVANTITASIESYESLVHGEMLEPVSYR